MSELYRPSNGTEGDSFMAKWCDHCAHDKPGDPCMILIHTHVYHIGDPEYPKEWIEDEQGPRCTAFKARVADYYDKG